MEQADKADLKKWITKAAKGRRADQEKIYKLLYGTMMMVCSRYAGDSSEAKDLCQDGFIKLFDNLARYDFNGSFEGWARRLFTNNSIDYLRKKARRRLSFDSEKLETREVLELHETEDNDSIYEGLSVTHIVEEVQKLPPAYRTTFNLFVFEGMGHLEIAEELGVTEGTSKSNLSKARAKLKEALTKYISENEHV